MADIGTLPRSGNREAAYCYLAGILFPIVYLTSEPYKSNAFLRFHSFQSIVFMTCFAAVKITNDSVQFRMRGVNTLLSGTCLLFFTMWVVLIVKAYRGQRFKLPIVGDLAARWAGGQLE